MVTNLRAAAVFTVICVISLCFCTRQACGAQYTQTVTPSSQYLSTPNAFNGSFANQYFSSSYVVSWGTVQFSFADNNDTLTSTSSTQYHGGSYLDYYYTRQYTNDNPYESVQVQTGAQVSSGSTPYYRETHTDHYSIGRQVVTGSHEELRFDWDHFRFYWETVYEYDTAYDHYEVYYINQGYRGAFSITQTLDEAALDAIRTTGTLPFVVTETAGDMNFLSAQLTFDAEPVPTNAVPLPSALLLLGPALAGLVAVRRRFKK